MDKITQTNLINLFSEDRDLQNRAFFHILEETKQSVDWAYEVWDDLLDGLAHEDNHVRAIAAQVLCNLAKSDPEGRMLKDFDRLLAVTKDERFVTARHTLQSIWKVGAAGKPQQKILVDGLAGRYEECTKEKNCTLIRFDIIHGLRNLYDQVADEAIKDKALALIEMEKDDKYRKKYAGVWKDIH
jgi:HEAT repeat protein